MKITDWVSVQEVLEDFEDFTGDSGENQERLLKKWAHDCVEYFLPASQFDFAILSAQIKNYSVELPEGFHSIVQVAFRTKPDQLIQRERIVEWAQDIYGTDCKLRVNLDCPKCHSKESCKCAHPPVIVDVDRIYHDAHPEHLAKRFGHFYGYGNTTGRPCSLVDPRFHIINPTSFDFKNMKYHIPDCVNFTVETEINYEIVRGGLRFNTQEGEAIVSYLMHPMDDDGYRLIPNSAYAFEAIQRFIEERLAYRQARMSKNPQDRAFFIMNKQLSDKAISDATTYFDTLDPREFDVFLRNHVRKVVPYYNYKQNLNRNERDRYIHPEW